LYSLWDRWAKQDWKVIPLFNDILTQEEEEPTVPQEIEKTTRPKTKMIIVEPNTDKPREEEPIETTTDEIPPEDEYILVVWEHEKKRGRIPRIWNQTDQAVPWNMTSYLQDRNNQLVEAGHEKIQVKVQLLSNPIVFTKKELFASLQYGNQYVVYVVDQRNRTFKRIANLVRSGLNLLGKQLDSLCEDNMNS